MGASKRRNNLVIEISEDLMIGS